MAISTTDFRYLQELVYNHAGIVIGSDKTYLAEARLVSLARENGGSLGELIYTLRTTPFHGLHSKVVEAMATCETLFFRDLHPFEALKKIVAEKINRASISQDPLYIWSAACATGQEAYSIAMTLREAFPGVDPSTFKVVASDFSDQMMDRARRGRFLQSEMNRGLPAALLVKYFTREAMEWQIGWEIREMVSFWKVNLTKPWPILPKMDVIFLRNVLIYFDLETKKNVLTRVGQLLKPDGYLFLGGAETTLNLDPSFEPVQFGRAVCYRLRSTEEEKNEFFKKRNLSNH